MQAFLFLLCVTHEFNKSNRPYLLEAARAQMLEQAGRRILHHIQHTLETVRPAKIRIRHFPFGVTLGELQKQAEMALRVAWAQALKNFKIRFIHRQHIIKTIKICDNHLSASQVAQIITAFSCRTLRARIRCLADVVIVRASRIDQDLFRQASLLDLMAEHRLGGG